MGTVLLVGTRKGQWIGRSDDRRQEWTFTGPHHNMEEGYSGLVDVRAGSTPRIFAGASSSWLGPQVRWSDDFGETWRETPGGGVKFPEGSDAAVERVWQLVAGAEPGVVWAGTEPGAVWRSDDNGETFALVEGLWNHPQRPEWGAGFGGQAFHTVLPHPTDPQSVTAAISTGGVYRTTDGGASWAPRSKGISARFMPEGQQFPEFGQCVHKVARSATQHEVLYAQNHGGVYRSDDGGESWTGIGDGLPSDFGFPLAIDPADPDSAYVIPLNADVDRVTPGGRVRVYETRDGGASWSPRGDGLPQRHAYLTVLRQAFASTGAGPSLELYFGATSGDVYGSADAGASWFEAATRLPPVYSVRAGERNGDPGPAASAPT
jgi:hypothetical protein